MSIAVESAYHLDPISIELKVDRNSGDP